MMWQVMLIIMRLFKVVARLRMLQNNRKIIFIFWIFSMTPLQHQHLPIPNSFFIQHKFCQNLRYKFTTAANKVFLYKSSNFQLLKYQMLNNHRFQSIYNHIFYTFRIISKPHCGWKIFSNAIESQQINIYFRYIENFLHFIQ